MRQYKHKTSGHVATQSTSGKTYKVKEPEIYTLPKAIIEDSCDWELIKININDNRDYEVIAYNFNGLIWKKQPNGNFVTNENSNLGKNEVFESTLLAHETTLIHAIKRKSDGAEFKVGGYVTPSYSDFIYGDIKKFEPVGNTIQIWGNFSGLYGMGFINQLNPFEKREFEILEMVYPRTNSVFTFKNGVCETVSSMPHASTIAIATAISLLDWSRLNITKIKRISDGETFAIGDNFKYAYVTAKIEKIEFEIDPANKQRNLSFIHDNKNLGKWLLLSLMEKLKPVFVTVDGVEKFTNDKYFAIEEYSKGYTVVPYILGTKPNGDKQYSTFEAAKEGLKLYQKSFSINDFERVLGTLPSEDVEKLIQTLKKSDEGEKGCPFDEKLNYNFKKRKNG